jgi:hypothetical protein
MQERRTRPATAEDFHRLAGVAHQRGLRLFRDGTRWYCTSASDAGGCHYVTGFSCTCTGFIAHQRCTHHALLLERLGWLPEIIDVDEHQLDAVNIDSPSCTGCGVVVYRTFEERCPDCGGSGVRVDRRLTGQPRVMPVAAAA